jgi:GWxTD domain-containing protein
MKLRLLFILILALPLIPRGARPQIAERVRPFEISAVQASDDSGKVYIDLRIDIRYSRLVFFRRDGKFAAEYRVFLEFYLRGRERMIRGEVFSGDISVGSYAETRSSRKSVNIRKRIYLDPGEYDIEAAVEVIGTEIRYRREAEITLSESEIFISDPVFYVSSGKNRDSKPPGGELRLDAGSSAKDPFYRRPSGVYTDPGSWLMGTVTISSPATEGRITVSVQVLDRDNRIIYYNRGEFEQGSGKSLPLEVDINVDGLKPGSYTLAVSASADERSAGSEEDFVVLFNLQSFTSDFENTLDLLSLIAPEEELTELAGSSPSERVLAWEKFWSGSGDSRNLENFREKIAYAAANFSGSRPGWESDMGRVYIRNGKPDRSVTRWSRWGGERYNLWYYYSLGMVYVFVDSFGTGDYRLIDTRNI